MRARVQIVLQLVRHLHLFVAFHVPITVVQILGFTFVSYVPWLRNNDSNLLTVLMLALKFSLYASTLHNYVFKKKWTVIFLPWKNVQFLTRYDSESQIESLSCSRDCSYIVALRIREYFAEESNGDDYLHFGVHTSFASALKISVFSSNPVINIRGLPINWTHEETNHECISGETYKHVPCQDCHFVSSRCSERCL